MFQIFLILFLSSFFSLPLKAHPVVYKGGFVYWGQFSHHSNTQRMSYTFHPRFAFETNRAFYHNFKNYRDAKIGFNALLKRWALEDSQGNIYVGVHGGRYRQAGSNTQSDTESNTEGRVLHSMIEADWESRELYTTLSVASFHLDDKNVEKLSYRIGFAPYVVGMDALQTWMIFQFDYFKEIKDRVKITPMMRFFYKNALWEMGANFQSEFFLTLMVHY
ncbi:MAG: hypothetical protein OXB88_02060 [Bacteriovoracales bacterium]|nr:hypothetical protein [Bacteriovoracales bacterium]